MARRTTRARRNRAGTTRSPRSRLGTRTRREYLTQTNPFRQSSAQRIQDIIRAKSLGLPRLSTQYEMHSLHYPSMHGWREQTARRRRTNKTRRAQRQKSRRRKTQQRTKRNKTLRGTRSRR